MGHIVVSGSASGIGAAVADQLKSAGHKIISVDRHNADIVADLSTPAGRQEATEEIRRLATSGLKGLALMAGLSGSENEASSTVAVNFFGAINLVQDLKDLMVDKKASIVLAGSIAARMPMSSNDLFEALLDNDEARALAICEGRNIPDRYLVTKKALLVWARRNTALLASDGIRINLVAPAIVDTPMVAEMMKTAASSAAILSVVGDTPLGRMAQSEEIAACVCFLLSEQASYVTGSVLYADGGYDAATRSDEI